MSPCRPPRYPPSLQKRACTPPRRRRWRRCACHAAGPRRSRAPEAQGARRSTSRADRTDVSWCRWCYLVEQMERWLRVYLRICSTCGNTTLTICSLTSLVVSLRHSLYPLQRSFRVVTPPIHHVNYKIHTFALYLATARCERIRMRTLQTHVPPSSGAACREEHRVGE